MDEVERQVFKDAVLANDNRLHFEEKKDNFDRNYGYKPEFVKRRALFDENHEENAEVPKSLAHHKIKWKGGHGYFSRNNLDSWFSSVN